MGLFKEFLNLHSVSEKGAVLMEALMVIPFFFLTIAALVNLGSLIWETNLTTEAGRSASRIQAVNAYMNNCNYDINQFTSTYHYKNGTSGSWEVETASQSDSAYWAAEETEEPCEGIYCVSGLGEGEGPGNDVPHNSNSAPSINKNLVRMKFQNKENSSCKYCVEGLFDSLNSSTESVFYVPNVNCNAS